MMLHDRHESHTSRNVLILCLLVVLGGSILSAFLLWDSNAPLSTVNATTKPIEATLVTIRVMPNELVTESNDERYFIGFYSSACYYAGKTRVTDSGDWANFNVIGYEKHQGTNAIYSFTVRDGQTFYLYGKTYVVSFDSYNTSILVLTQTS